MREVEDELGTQAAVAAYQQQVQAAQAADEAARQEVRAGGAPCEERRHASCRMWRRALCRCVRAWD